MKKLKLLLILPLLVMLLYGGYSGTLTSTPQDLTNAWVDLGAEIGVSGYSSISILVNIDVNDSIGIRFKVKDKYITAGADEWNRVTISTTANKGILEANYLQYDVVADDKFRIQFDVGGRTNSPKFVQFQVMAGTVGVSAGQIDTAYYSLEK